MVSSHSSFHSVTTSALTIDVHASAMKAALAALFQRVIIGQSPEFEVNAPIAPISARIDLGRSVMIVNDQIDWCKT